MVLAVAELIQLARHIQNSSRGHYNGKSRGNKMLQRTILHIQYISIPMYIYIYSRGHMGISEDQDSIHHVN